MSLFKKAARFAQSPQGRRAIAQARARLDTPENRQKVSDAVRKVRSSRSGPGTGAGPTSATGPG